MSDDVVVPIPVFIDVHDVMRTMKCSRTRAYDHMRAAIGREAGERGQLRVPVYVWHRYVQRTFEPGGSRRNEEPSGVIPITRARTKPNPEAS